HLAKEHDTIFESILGQLYPSQRRRFGAYFTPKPIIDFMLALTEEAFHSDFPTACVPQIIDPAMGTGAFFERMKRNPSSLWQRSLKIGYEMDTPSFLFAKMRFQNDKDVTVKNRNTLQHLFDNDIKPSFDTSIVIGNPPYSKKNDRGDTHIPYAYAKNNYDQNGHFSGYSGQNSKSYVPTKQRNKEKINDLYSEFIGASLKLCGSNGIVCLITPNTYLSIPSYRYFRHYILKNYDVRYIVNFSNISERNSIFQPFASIATSIIVLSTRRREQNIVRYLDLSRLPSITSKVNSFVFPKWKASPKTIYDLHQYTLRPIGSLPFVQIKQNTFLDNLGARMRVHTLDPIYNRIERGGIPIREAFLSHQGVDVGDVRRLTAKSPEQLQREIEYHIFQRRGTELNRTSQKHIAQQLAKKRLQQQFRTAKIYPFVYQKQMERWKITDHDFVYMDHGILWRSRIQTFKANASAIFEKHKLFVLERREKQEILAVVTSQKMIPQHGGRFFYLTVSRKLSIDDLYVLCAQINSKLMCDYYRNRAQGNRNIPVIPPSHLEEGIRNELSTLSREMHHAPSPTIQNRIDELILDCFSLNALELSLYRKNST
ncbi:MAG: N-6 DNA methylase, partial [Myxococcota bacterium]|nr:N-6 DNA methylase [Myxococcota bacterium]